MGNGTYEVTITTGFKPKFVWVRAKVEEFTSSSDWFISYMMGLSVENLNTAWGTISSSTSQRIASSMAWFDGMSDIYVAQKYVSSRIHHQVYQGWTIRDTGFSVTLYSSTTTSSSYLYSSMVCNLDGITYNWIAFS